MTIPLRSPLATVLATLVTLGCGGGGTTTMTEPPPPVVTTIQVQDGGGQTARIGQVLSAVPTVVVRDQSGSEMSGIAVTFSVSAGGGTLAGSSATTNASGVAAVPTWTLGSAPGPNTVTATAVGGANPSTQIIATARPPRWTILVYMAADNTLAPSGIGDIDEMEAAGSNPEVQVVLQAEFNPTAFSQVGVTPSKVHLPNYNTVRYEFGGLTSLASRVVGPNGSVTDIGNRNMTDPNELRDFINWGKQTYPAERYAVVLWNHGGGYQGLLSDETSSGGQPMTLPQLKTALSTVGPIDVVDFDMCLMGGYETLAAINGVAKFAAFSEEVEPGEGDSYAAMLQALYANPTMDGKGLATTIVNTYDAFYVNGQPSTTKSAYDLAGLAAFETALSTAAQALTANIASLAPAIASSAVKSQKFETLMFTDVGDFIDSLSTAVTDPTIRSQLAAVGTQAKASSFRITSKARNGTSSAAGPVTKATGISIVMPSGYGDDWFWPAGYPLSLDAYQAAMPGKAWTQFLTAYSAQLSAPAATYVDLGANRWELYLVWDTAAVSRNADLDLWVVEPNGSLYIPYLGTVTANGALSSDSEKDRTYFEGYLMNRYVQTGRYWFYANLYTDPQNFQPVFDIEYRQNAGVGLTSLYAPTYPRVSMQTSWLNDPTPTFDEANAGAYTDLKLATYLDIAAASPNIVTASPFNVRTTRSVKVGVRSPLRIYSASTQSRPLIARELAPSLGSAVHSITSAQLKTVRANWSAREIKRKTALPHGTIRPNHSPLNLEFAQPMPLPQSLSK